MQSLSSHALNESHTKKERKMKRTNKIIALLLAAMMLIIALTACSPKLGKPMASLGDSEITVNMYMLYLSRAKGGLTFVENDAYFDSFWDMIVDKDGSTYNDLYCTLVLDNVKTILAAAHVFDELNLKLSSAVVEEIDTEMKDLVEYIGEGSKTALNGILSEFGANYDILREVYILEAKAQAVKDELFGVDAAKVSDLLKQNFMEENYARFKQVFLYTVMPQEELDKDGNIAYFDPDTKEYIYVQDGTTTAKKDANGEYVTDKFDNIVYVDADGKIAYDKEKGLTARVYDKDGEVVTRKATDEELAEIRAKAKRIEGLVERGDDFDTLVMDYSEAVGKNEYTNGYYLTEGDDYEIAEVKKALFEMKDGEVRTVYSDYGIHIVKRYELDDGAFSNPTNADFFKTFNSAVVEYLFLLRMEEYYDEITIDESAIKGIDMKSVGANIYY